jgi:hypothetical protein
MALYRNGIAAASNTLTNTSNFNSAYKLIVGAFANSTGGTPPQDGFYLNGSVNEILVYLGSMTSTQRQTVEGYLAWKWGLQASLPGTHPYSSAAPMLTSSIVTYGTETIDSNLNLQIAALNKVRVTAPTEWRFVTSDVSATSLSLTSGTTSVVYRLTNTGFNALTLPSDQGTSNAGMWWQFYNTSGSNLSVTLTNTVSLSSPQVFSNATTYTLYWNGSSNYLMTNQGLANYLAATPANWSNSTPPTTISSAIDRIVAYFAANNIYV